jgi:hypothetical protein
MKIFLTLLLSIVVMMITTSLIACCGSEYENPSTVPPPPPGFDNITPSINIGQDGYSIENTYNLTRSFTKEWIRPFSITNEYGVYTFSTIGNKVYYRVETSNGSIFMTRY